MILCLMYGRAAWITSPCCRGRHNPPVMSLIWRCAMGERLAKVMNLDSAMAGCEIFGDESTVTMFRLFFTAK